MKYQVSHEQKIICGMIPKYRDLCILILGEYVNHNLLFSGTVTYGVNLRRLGQYPFIVSDESPFQEPILGLSSCIWFLPQFQCTLERIQTNDNSFRLPILIDILPNRVGR